MMWLAWLWIAVSLAADVVVVTPDGDAAPGRLTRVHVAATTGPGVLAQDVRLAAERGAVVADEDPDAAPGVSSWLWTPPGEAGDTVMRVTVDGEAVPVELPVRAWPDLDLGLPDRIDVLDGAPIVLRLDTDDPPGPDDLVVRTSEEADIAVDLVEGVPTVTVRPSGSGSRSILVALQDRRLETRPERVAVRVVERPTLTFDVEPGATLTVDIRGRRYGPFVADESGRVRATIEQRPGDRSAEIVVRDDLGNELTTPYLLSGSTRPALVLVEGRAPRPGEIAPDVVVWGTTPGGRPLAVEPECQIPGGTGQAPLARLAPGLWRVGAARRLGTASLRLSCTAGDTRRELRVAPPSGRAEQLDLRVGPDPISLDFPVGEVTVRLLDGQGERLPPTGVTVVAERGAVRLEPPSGGTLRGEYRAGSAALVQGSDTVIATWSHPPGQGSPASVQVAHGRVPSVGPVRVHGRALDARGRPLVGAEITLATPTGTVTGPADETGWFSAELDTSQELDLVRLRASVGPHEARRLAPRGAPPLGGGPGLADLTARQVVTLTSGRTSTIEITPDTPVLYLDGDAQLTVRIELFDRGGQPVVGEVPSLSVDRGLIGAPRPDPEGGFRAVYTPRPDASPGEVTITARAGAGTAIGTTRVRLTTPPPLAVVGVAVGGTTNLGLLTSALASLDADLRLPVDPFFVRMGVSAYNTARTVETDVGVSRTRITLFPVTAAALYRPHRGRWPLWVGLGVQLAPFVATPVFDETRLPAQRGVLGPGVQAIFGVGRRVGPGELMFEVRPTFLTGSSASLITGQFGGAQGVLGFRAVID